MWWSETVNKSVQHISPASVSGKAPGRLTAAHSTLNMLLVFSLQNESDQTHITKWFTIPSVTLEDGRHVFTSAKFQSAPCCELNWCKKTAFFSQWEADRAEETQLQATGMGGETSDLSAFSSPCCWETPLSEDVYASVQRNTSDILLWWLSRWWIFLNLYQLKNVF